MSNRDISFYIIDIFIAIDKIQRYTKEFQNAQELLYSELHWDGSLRELEIIGEASNYLLKANVLNKKYRRIVDFRNQIIHGYFGVDENIVYQVIKEKLPLLYEDLKNLTTLIDINKALENSKLENIKNKNTVHFLERLKKELKI